jgi:lipopolysaccharide transport protein LptA
MVYEEAQNRIVYRGDAAIRQGDIATRSPEATLNLEGDASGIETLVAGSPVQVEQADRTATGATGTYTPATGTMVLVGEPVVLKDPSQVIEGRSVTFRVGDDLIVVDGREEVRTQLLIKKEPRPQ